MGNPPFLPGLVTVIVPFFNRERFLPRTIASILRQSYPKLQLILSDDGSTDRSWSVAGSFRDRRILLIRSGKQRGKPHAVNQALRFAQGEWIAFFDSDDLMVPRSLEVRVDFLKRHPGALAVMGRVGRLIDGSGKPLPKNHPIQKNFRDSLRTTRLFARWLGSLNPELFAFGECPLSPLSVTLFRCKTVDRLGKIEERFAPWEDREYVTRLALQQPVPFLDASVMWYRVHRKNLSFRILGGCLFHPKQPLLERRLKARYTELSGQTIP